MLQPGDQIDIWVVERALGAGGMGSVYRCHNRHAKRILAAIKVLEVSLRRIPGAEARFIREAEILFQLEHPNIVKVRNVRTDVDPPYLEMEFVEGRSLENILAHGALEPGRALHIATQLCDAIRYLHSKGIRHRDIKPANVLLDGDRAKLVDFGLAVEAGMSRITEEGMTFGTVSYAPPEWIDPERLNPTKWDLYALGVVMYEMLTGTVAFPVSHQGSVRQQAMQVMAAKQNHAPLDPGEGFEEDVRELVRQLTQAERDKRPGSAQQVYEWLTGTGRGETIVPWPQETVSTTPQRAIAHTWVDTRGGATTADDGPNPSSQVPAKGGGALAFGVGAVVAFGIALLSIAVVLAVSFWPTGESAPSTRDVRIAVQGLEEGMPVSMASGDVDATAGEGPQAYVLPALAAGPVEVRWAAGEGCTVAVCPGEGCPAWCVTGTHRFELEAGDRPHGESLSIQAPPPRDVVVRLASGDGSAELSAWIGTRAGESEAGQARFSAVQPGSHTVRAELGTCPDDAAGCYPDACPEGCASVEVPVSFGPGEEAHVVDIELVVSAAPAGTSGGGKADAPPAEPPPAAEAPAPASSGVVVTVSSFATWLAANPGWQREAAQSSGWGDANYLKGWNGSDAPAGVAGGSAVVNVSWFAADAYCKSRGGLADVDSPPTWSGAHYVEWRMDEGGPAWRGSDGTRSQSRVDKSQTLALTGFRCFR